MDRLNKIAYYLMASINTNCKEEALKWFTDDDFILAKDANLDVCACLKNEDEVPIKYIKNEFHILKRTEHKRYNTIYDNNLEKIIDNLLKENKNDRE